jgi:hypothetical protein
MRSVLVSLFCLLSSNVLAACLVYKCSFSDGKQSYVVSDRDETAARLAAKQLCLDGQVGSVKSSCTEEPGCDGLTSIKDPCDWSDVHVVAYNCQARTDKGMYYIIDTDVDAGAAAHKAVLRCKKARERFGESCYAITCYRSPGVNGYRCWCGSKTAGGATAAAAELSLSSLNGGSPCDNTDTVNGCAAQDVGPVYGAVQ